MIQKTYHVTGSTGAKIKTILTEVSALPSYQSAAQVLLLLFEQNWEQNLIREKIALIHALLPKAEVIGTTHTDEQLYGQETKNCVLTFLMFEHPKSTCPVKTMKPSGTNSQSVWALCQARFRA